MKSNKTPTPCIPDSWADLPFFTGDDWPKLWGKLARLGNWQPPSELLFHALERTPRHKVKIVILGQDPYHTEGRATGLAFAFPPKAPPRYSLRNIFKELHDDSGLLPPAPDLTSWADQGVLLLNTALSVPVGQAHGHKNLGWITLIKQVLNAVSSDGPKAFILWGNPAQELCRGIARDKNHLFIETAHPSPFAAHRGFFGSRPFSRVNEWLLSRGETPINWAGKQ